MEKKMLEDDADVVEMRMNRCLGVIKRKCGAYISAMTISQPQLFDDYFVSFFGINILSVNLCGKLHRIELFQKAKLTPSGFKMGEDLIMSMRLFPYIRNYVIIDYYGYNYRVGGLTSKYNPTLWSDLKQQYFIKRECLMDNHYEKALRYLNIELKNILISSVAQRIEYLKEDDTILREWVLGELEDEELWHDIRYNMSKSETDEIYKFIAEKNADAIIVKAQNNLYARRWRRRLKKTAMSIIGIGNSLKKITGTR